MTSNIQNEVAAKVETLIAYIVATVRPVPNPIKFKGQLDEIGKLLLDPVMQKQAAPVSQMWRLLMGLHLAEFLTEDDLYVLAGQFRDCSRQLYPAMEG